MCKSSRQSARNQQSNRNKAHPRRHHQYTESQVDVRVPQEPAESSGSGWAVGARADALCTVRADTDAVLAWTHADFWAQLAALLQSLPAEARTRP